jgi:hypothetical protein
VFNFADNFSATISTAAWRTKPSWMLVAGSDRTISPDLERWYARRAKSHTVEVAGASHSVYVSHPKEVTDVIESAARAVSKYLGLRKESRSSPRGESSDSISLTKSFIEACKAIGAKYKGAYADRIIKPNPPCALSGRARDHFPYGGHFQEYMA